MVTNGSAMHKISSKLTLTETFNIDLEHSNPTFSLDTSLLDNDVGLQVFGCRVDILHIRDKLYENFFGLTY